ncbi:MAG: acyltransferase family protein [Mucilaginibacter sp.]
MDPFNSKFITRESRWPWMDYDKGISIILVGYAHCYFALNGYGPNLKAYPVLNYIDVFLYGFRMPLFFIISGLLVSRSLNKKGLKKYITDRANTILYPLLIWGFLEISLKIINARLNPNMFHDAASPIDYLDLIINPRVTGHLWYLNALFCIGVVYTVIKSKLGLTASKQLIIGFVLYGVSGYIHINRLDMGALTDIFEYYFFFALGDVISHIMFAPDSIERFSSWKIFVPLTIAFLLIQFYCATLNITRAYDGIAYVEHRVPLLYMVQVLIGCAFSISASFLLQKLNKLRFLRLVGYHSLYVYCMQIITMTLLRVIFLKIFKLTYVPVLFPLVWGLGVILPIFAYNFFMSNNLWWLFTFKKPQRQVNYLKEHRIFSIKPQESANADQLN